MNSESKFQVKVGEFEGPLEVLLDLIEERKLHISQVSLAAVADAFIEHMQKFGERLEKGMMANFVLVASTLMLIKSISLLPTLPVTPEESSDMQDLERRLRLLERVRSVSGFIKERFGQQIIFTPAGQRARPVVFAPARDLTLATVVEAIKAVINNLPKTEAIPQVVVRKVLSLEEAITDLAKRVQGALRMSFKDFVRDKAEKVNVIVSFLGMLELVKRGIVTVEQSAQFDDIAIETAGPSNVPRYE